jgi:hypothetical protein
MAKASSKPTFLGSATAKVLGATALVVAGASLVNGAVDLYRAVANVPTNIYDRTNDELFKRNFGKQPVVSQPVQIKASDVTVEMLLQVYDTGDVFVRYGTFQQWLPFQALRSSSNALVAELLAQALPTPSGRGAIVIDVDKLKAIAGKASIPADSPAPTSPSSIEKNYVLAKIKDDHPSLFSSSTATYTEVFKAEKGFKIARFEFQLSSANNSQVRQQKLAPDGSSVTITFALTSGPMIDRYRGWIQGTVKTLQQKAP